ncbi:uncharacterized protein LOC118189735 [Stegodyphus dumicola]|uniref:uncharacterized protein LOC118189735 n=1 Tax=Stegodyphus dumicola TaxID=202533 RepID=UPI0015ABCAC9|nr:uncharacterized protein LOC118189735 [Stegodyphus dumicola]
MFRMKINVLWFLTGVIASTYSYDDTKIFSCDFTEDNCGIVNQVGMRAKWNRKELDIGGRKGIVMAIDTTGKKGQIGRMISPYFELHRQASGCLSLDLFISGEGPITFRVEEQTDSGFQKILTVRNQVPHWRTYDLDVNIPEYVRVSKVRI